MSDGPLVSAQGVIRWTDEQRDAITSLGKSLLVSAAAGSGKTAVLAERCVHLVCEKPRCSVNQLLVVTFTEAAALEMRSRIEQALRRRLEGTPGDGHLRRQVALLEHIQCSTLHSFCHRLLTQHFHRLGLDPSFRVLDADEAVLMRQEIVRELFMDRYDGEGSEAFGRFIDAYGDGQDEQLMAAVVDTHELLCSLVDRGGWVVRSLGRIDGAAGAALESSELGRDYLSLLRMRLGGLDRDCAAAAEALRRLPAFAGYVGYLERLSASVGDWAAALEGRGYDALVAAVQQTQIPRLPSVPNSTAGKEAAMALVGAVQKQLKGGQLAEALRFTQGEMQDGLRSIQPHAEVFLDLVREFDQRYRGEKDAAHALDFSDLERFALQLLSNSAQGGDGVSPVARLLHRQFQHVLVDEYQDINEVQDTILRLSSHECVAEDGSVEPNLFCVGDVKQSIYRFRLAEPMRFLERYERYRQPGSIGRVIDLQANFRSRKPLLDALNRVFERLMVREAAEIEYDESHRLFAKADYPAAEGVACFIGAPIELHYLPAKLDEDDEDAPEVELERAEREALLVADRIEEMMGRDGGPRMQVMERGADGSRRPRAIEYRDMVILLRATRYHADEYASMLRWRGIPVYNTGGSGYFDSMEVRDILAVLRLLDNQRQDIPMAAVLRSPLCGLAEPDDSLARIRIAYPHSGPGDREAAVPFHEAVVRYAGEKGDELGASLRGFLERVGHWRTLARHRPVADLIWAIYEESGYLAFCNGLENGPQRCANLMRLHERARQFGAFSRQGLYRFIRFLESLREETDPAQASDLSEAENVVRVMSIHKSKGLEFPVVFLPALGKRINFQGCTSNIMADRHAGLGLYAVDERKQIRYPSLASMLVSDRLRRQTIAEELRILYVAMTRAKEHLVLVGTCKSGAAEGWHRAWDMHRGALPPNTILSGKTMLDWLGPVAAAFSGEDEPPIQIYDHPAEEVEEWAGAAAKPAAKGHGAAELVGLKPLEREPALDSTAADVIERLRTVYPYPAFTSLRASVSVTEWAKQGPAGSGGGGAGGGAGLEEAGYLMEQPLSAADRGTAAHLFLEHLDFSGCETDGQLQDQLSGLVKKKLMTDAQAAAIEMPMIRWFLESDVGRLLREGAGRLLRELPLNYALAPDRFIGVGSLDPVDGVMVRGRIDLLLSDEDGFTLIDYKTDAVWGDGIAQRCELYRPQVDLYREAIQRITGRAVHTVYLVFLTPRRNVAI